MTVGENIRKIRTESHMTMKQLAEKINVSEQAIGNYERGDRKASTEILINIAKALNCDITKLIYVEDIEKKIINAKDGIDKRGAIFYTIGQISSMLSSGAYSNIDMQKAVDHLYCLYKDRTSLDILKELIIKQGYDIENVDDEILNKILKKVSGTLDVELNGIV